MFADDLIVKQVSCHIILLTNSFKNIAKNNIIHFLFQIPPT